MAVVQALAKLLLMGRGVKAHEAGGIEPGGDSQGDVADIQVVRLRLLGLGV